MEMKYVSDLSQYSHADLMHIHNFGRKSLNEIVALFAAEGLPLGITLPEDFSQSRNATPSDDATIEKSESKIELSSDQKAFLASPLSQFFFTARATNFLKRAKLKRVGDLAVLQAAQLRQMQDLGVKSVQELTAFLSKNDIQFGIRIPEWSEELGLAWERQFSSLSDNRRQLDPYLLADPAPKSLDQELYGLTKLVMGAGQERNTRIVCRFFGFDGTGRKTLEEVGAEH